MRRHRPSAGLAAILLAVATVCAIPTASTRPLGSIEARGLISLCAHPNALPFASRKDDPPGFQIELARAIAAQLGVALDTAWVVSPIQYRSAECDIVMDTIVNEQVAAMRRGLLYSIVQGGWPLGVFLAAGVYQLFIGYGWRFVFLLGIIPLLAVIVELPGTMPPVARPVDALIVTAFVLDELQATELGK